MDHEPHLQTSNILLVAAIAVCTVMGIVTLLPAFRAQGNSTSQGGSHNYSHAAVRDHAPQNIRPGVYLSSDATAQNKQLPHSRAAVTANIVSDSNSGDSAGRSVVVQRSVSSDRIDQPAFPDNAALPQIYVPVTVHPVNVTVDNGSMTADMARIHDALQQLKLQKQPTPELQPSPPASGDSFSSQVEQQAQQQAAKQQLDAIQARLDSMTAAIENLSRQSSTPAMSAAPVQQPQVFEDQSTSVPDFPASAESPAVPAESSFQPATESPSYNSDPPELNVPDFTMDLNESEDNAELTFEDKVSSSGTESMTGPLGHSLEIPSPDELRMTAEPAKVDPTDTVSIEIIPFGPASSSPRSAVPPVPPRASENSGPPRLNSIKERRNKPASLNIAQMNELRPLDMTPDESSLSATSAPSPYSPSPSSRSRSDLAMKDSAAPAVFQNTYRFAVPPAVASSHASPAKAETYSTPEFSEPDSTSGRQTSASGAMEKPAARQIRPSDKSKASPLKRSISYLNSRTWIPDFDMPRWLDRWPESSRKKTEEKSAEERSSDEQPQTLHRAASAIRYAARPTVIQD